MCSNRLSIINPRYRKYAEILKVNVRHFNDKEDYRLFVPCGHCDECLKQRQQHWFSRANHIMKRMNLKPEQCLFCTFTLKPSVYESAKEKPYVEIRRFIDRLRKHPRFRYRDPITKHYKYRKVKFPYLFVVEFADGKTAARRGRHSSHRMHYHAILFGCPLYWWQIRDLWQGDVVDESKGWYTGLGKAEVEPLDSEAGIRYVLKYMTKDCAANQYLSVIDARKNGKLVVSHGFGRLSNEDIREWRKHMLKNASSWFCHYINNFRYSIPRYWKNACFTELERRCRNDSLIPRILMDMVKRRYRGLPYQQQSAIYNTLLWP
jgi:hypothetical protein